MCDQHIVQRVTVIVHDAPEFGSGVRKEDAAKNQAQRTESALLMSLLSLLASTALTLLPQHTTAKKIALATTDY